MGSWVQIVQYVSMGSDSAICVHGLRLCNMFSQAQIVLYVFTGSESAIRVQGFRYCNDYVFIKSCIQVRLLLLSRVGTAEQHFY